MSEQNLELKAYVSSNFGFEKELKPYFKETLHQTDTYFKTNDGIQRLKLREEIGKTAYVVRYDREDKNKERICIYDKYDILDVPQFKKVIYTGLTQEVVVEKKRQLYLYENARIHIDTVNGLLPTFVEIEVVIKTEEERTNAPKLMDTLKNLLKIKPENILRVSYRELLMKNKVLLVGAGSFLGVNLARLFEEKGIESVCVSKHKENCLSEIPYETLDDHKCIVYVRPDVDKKLLEMKAKDRIPIISIGSGALVDFKSGKIPKTNPYIEGKQKLVEMSTCSIHPGFYIPSGDHLDTGRGLHRDTLMTLFGPNEIPKDYNMDKAYYMTPVNELMEIICDFVNEPTKYKGEYAFGSPMAISREELHTNTKPKREREYANDMEETKNTFGKVVTDEDIASFHKKAKTWIEKNQ